MGTGCARTNPLTHVINRPQGRNAPMAGLKSGKHKAESGGNAMLFLVDSDATYYTHYCRANVCISEDWNTHQVTVSAYIGTAPNDTTVIVYPYHKDEIEYLSKPNARKLAAQFKRELREYVKAKGIKLSEPIAYMEYFQ